MKKVMPIIVIVLGVTLLISISISLSLIWVQEPLKLTLWESLNDVIPILSICLLVIYSIGFFLKLTGQKTRALWVTPMAIVGLLLSLAPSILGLEYPARLSDTEPTLAVRVPLDGKVVVAWGGDDVRKNYHAAYPDQRWAYDLVMEPHSLRSSKLSDYGCFGKAVLAPVAGEIQTGHDGDPDRIPDENASPPENVFGNYIVIKPDGQNTRLILAHLKQNSLSVQRGDRVEEGQAIAECGNSGNTTEPHIHIHLVAMHEDGDDIKLTGLPLFFRDHSGQPMPSGGFHTIDGRSVAGGDTIEHQVP